MLTTTMDNPPRDQTPVRPSPLQARALHFLKKLVLRGRGSGRKSKDSISPVVIPSQDFHRARSSIDILRKPDMSRLVGFRVEDGTNPMDTEDSSQDASRSGNSPCLRPRRYSAGDSLRIAPIHSTFAGHGPAPSFFHDQAGLGNEDLVDPGRPLVPAPMFLRSNPCLDIAVLPARNAGSSPEIPSRIDVAPELKHNQEAVFDIPNNDTPRPSGHVLPYDASLTNSLADPSPLTPSDPGAFSRTQSNPAPEDSALETVARERPTLLPHHSAPLPPPFRLTTERGLRLSPSIITRQPIPLLNLPALPPPPPAPDTPSRQRVRLRSMPSLSRHGRCNMDCEADHENAMLGDSDEEDGEEGGEEEFVDASCGHQSDDEDDELPSAGPSSTRGLESSQKRPLRDAESPLESPISPVSTQSSSVGPSFADCVCSETYVQSIHVASSSTSLEMYPFSPNITIAEDLAQRRPLDPDLSIPGARLEAKPSLYRATSRSMIDLGPPRRTERRPMSREAVGSSPASTPGHTAEHHEEPESDTEAAIGRLLRRTSMPSFHPTSDPPPYPTFDPRPRESRVVAHDDEERLPPYSNSLYLIAIMPRKMEFSSPGVQAKDRKWRRVVCELDGTVFRVYKCPPGASGGGVLGDWWERHVGVGDVAGPNPPRTRKKGPEEESETPAKLGIEEPLTPATSPMPSARPTSVPPPRRRTGSQSSMATQSTTLTPRPAKRMSAASFLSPFRGPSTTRPEPTAGESSGPESGALQLLPVDMQDNRSMVSQESAGRAISVAQPPPRAATRLSFLPVTTGRTPLRNGEILKPPESDLMRTYTLQHAESGLGNDYLKRKNVIRVRLEGEQFLLQAPDIPAVVEWIEGLHAGTNIALDIDQRPMPRGPMFPRRRRRRARPSQAQDAPGQRAARSS